MNRIRRWLAVPFAVVLIAALARFGTLSGGEDLLIQRQYQAAAEALQAALADTPVGEQDRVLLLLGEAQLLAGEPAAARATLQRLLAEQQGSALVPGARFLLARSHERLGDRQQAAALYRDEVERLCGFDRKEQVAAIYLGLAEKAQQQDPPQDARVVTFCDLALDLQLEPRRAAAVGLKAAEAQLRLGQHADAARRLVPLVEQLSVPDGKLRAMLGLGRARRLDGDPAGARTVLRDLQELAPDAPEAGDAAYEVALSFGVPSPAAGMLDRAVQALQDLQERFPSHGKAKIAAFLAAQSYASSGRADDALRMLRGFLAAQQDSGLDEVAAARAMQGDVLAAQQKLEPAIAAWREYLAQHPAHGEWERVQRAIVDAEWRLAILAYQDGCDEDDHASFAAARQRLQAFAQTYPLDQRNPDVLFLLGDMLRRERKFDDARAEFARCVSKYPGRDQGSRAQFAIGAIFEQETFDYGRALEAYRAVTWGPQQGAAQRRIAQLTEKHLELCTHRVFRTDEAPTFALTSRNIETVRVRVLRLDLEDYFRATHTAGGIEQLDIEVIAADRTFDSAVADYEPYRETTRDVELPFREPGAYVVKVDDRELEAVTMVLVSDLALIAKSSRHEFLVLTQDTRTGRVAPGVEVVLSDGAKIVAEGTTDAAGFWRFRGEELQNRDDLRVFAVAPGGSGASSLNLSGMGYSLGLQPKGYLFAARPMYLPGERVDLKGIVREIANGTYQLPGDGYRVRVLAPSGRMLLQRDVQFTTFGTFATELVLPAAAELGEWRVLVDRPGRDDRTFASQFRVQRFERPRLQLSLDLDQPVVFRGEPIRGRVVARWFYGEPAVGREVAATMQLPDGAVVERRGTTNAAGELPIELPTGEFAEEAMALLRAELVGEAVQTQAVVPVVTTELEPKVTLPREVYLAGETMEATVTLQDRSGAPLQRAAEAVLLRLEQPAKGRGATVEVEVERRAVRTAADGSAKVAFRAAAGGRHRVRVLCADRFGTVVTGEAGLLVSGDDDEVRLRLLCARETWKVGETAEVTVMNRAVEGLALLCWQGDGILACETRVLPAGESKLALPLRPEHAPNFALALAMVDGNRLHTADLPLLVQRDLRVVVDAPERAAPGGQVEVTVHTMDPQGRPVAAEVALAMVDEALLAIAGDGAPAIGAFFYGQLRETSFRTQSSCTWSYQGRSRPVNAELLAEELRRQVEADRRAPTSNPEPNDGRLDEVTSAFDSNQWNSAVGLGGGAGGRQREGRASLTGTFFDDGKDADRMARSSTALMQEEAKQSTYLVRRFSGADDKEAAGFFALEFGVPAGLEFASDEPRVDFRATGAWLSSVVTGDDGTAEVVIELPDSTTAWRLRARAVTADTWVGEGDDALVAQQALQVDYRGPSWLCEGDTTELGVRLHNLTAEAVNGRVELEQEFGPQPETQRESRGQDLPLPAHADAAATFPFAATAAGELGLTLRGTAGDRADAMQLRVPVQPFGLEVVAGRSGSTRDRVAFALGLPEGREYTALRMLIELGPDPSRDLVRAALGGGFQLRNCVQVQGTNLARASRGLAATHVLEWLDGLGDASTADREQLQGLVVAMLQVLVQAQRDDGSYAWIGDRTRDLRSSAQALRFLAACRSRGMAAADEPLHKLAEALLQAERTAADAARADLLWALAQAGRARFEALNALHRQRTGLGADALARLALAWQAHGRPELAGEVLDALAQALPPEAFANATQETVALAALAALQRGTPPTAARDPRVAAAADWLRQARRGAGWETPEATAAAIAVLARVRGSGAGAPRATEIQVDVGGHELATLPKEAEGLQSTFDVPVEWLRERDNEVAIAVRGGGEVFYNATLVGFRKGFLVEERNDELVRVRREFVAAPLRHEGRDVPAGFSVVTGRGYRTWRNEITQLGQGETCTVQTSFWIRRDADRARMTPVVLEEPLPAGCAVTPGSLQGNYEHVEQQPDRLVFYFRDEVSSATVGYALQARYPGAYRVLPGEVYSAQRPELRGHGPTAELAVRAPGDTRRDDYRLTPDELFWLGKAEFDAAQAMTGAPRKAALERAQAHLQQLLDEWHKTEHQLRDDAHKEVARRMLSLGIELGSTRQVVRFFEVLKDRYADVVIPFDEILAVGRAYFDLGEFESALLVFRATADASFLKDAAVATTLTGLGERKAATRFLEDLLRQYPDLPTMRVARYSIGQQLAAAAMAIDPSRPVDERVGTADELRQHALRAFREFLVRYPEDPLAEEVSFAWATTLLEGRDLDGALRTAEAALARYPQSPFEDELLYTAGYARFALGSYDEAFQALERVATGTFATDRGGRAESGSKWHAVYLQGQIWHARGEPQRALDAYSREQDRFTDAGEAMDYFQHKELSLPEVTTFATDEPAKLEVAFRNVERASVQVFRVDLMRLYLLERSLNDIRGIQLHGIAPLLALEVELGDGRDYRGRTREVPLHLDEPGAYLCVVRGGDLLATGMVLRSDLKLELQEQFDQGRLRVNVKQGDAFLAGAHVKVLGSGGGELLSGDTDLRGVFTADGLVGMATVIVQKDRQFAFFRGASPHQPARFRPAPVRAADPATEPGQTPELQQLRKNARGFEALEQNYLQNTFNRSKQVQWLQDEVLNKQQTGVEVYRAK
ncbi:MAG: MG2 domain-containing protein [Planctomycetota bacterium]